MIPLKNLFRASRLLLLENKAPREIINLYINRWYISDFFFLRCAPIPPGPPENRYNASPSSTLTWLLHQMLPGAKTYQANGHQQALN